MLFGRKAKSANVYVEPKVTKGYVYANELAERAQALVYGAQPLAGNALMGDCEVIEGDGCWQMKTDQSRSFVSILTNFRTLIDALRDDPTIEVTGYAYDKKGDVYPYPNVYHSFKNDRKMEKWLKTFGGSHLWYYHVRSLGVSVRAGRPKV